MSMVTLDPQVEASYIQDSAKHFAYDEVNVYKINDVASGVDVSQILSASSSRLRKLIMLPYFSKAGAIPNAMMSPYDGFGSGFLSSPYTSVSNFNVTVSGIPVYANPISHAELFYKNFQEMTLNGGVSSALLNQSMVDIQQYMTQYGAICVDLTKNMSKGVDDTSKNLAIEFQNNSALTCSYLIYVYYEKTIGVDVSSGHLVLENA
jgi:hypothetical protein